MSHLWRARREKNPKKISFVYLSTIIAVSYRTIWSSCVDESTSVFHSDLATICSTWRNTFDVSDKYTAFSSLNLSSFARKNSGATYRLVAQTHTEFSFMFESHFSSSIVHCLFISEIFSHLLIGNYFFLEKNRSFCSKSQN